MLSVSCAAADVSTSSGGAKITAVEETVAVADMVADVVAVTEAPTGSLLVGTFAFCAGFRRTGANARAADQA